MPFSLTTNGQNRPEATAVLVSWLALLAVAFGAPTVRRGETDFLSFYAGGKLAGTPYLYSVRHVHEIQKGYADPDQIRAYTRPPFYSAVFWPLGKLPYGIASFVWQILNLVALVLFVWLSTPARAFAAVLCCWNLPVWLAFGLGQDTALLLLLVALANRLLLAKHDFRAGLVFSLCSVKFHLFLLLPVLVLARRMRGFAIGFSLGATALILGSFLLAGRRWPVEYLELLLLNERSQASQGFMPNLVGLFHGIPGSRIWIGGFGLLTAAAVWRLARRSSLEHALAGFLCGSLLVSPHTFYYDLSLLIPILLLIRGWGRAAEPVVALMLVNIGIPLIGRFAVLPALIWVARELHRGSRAGPATEAAGG